MKYNTVCQKGTNFMRVRILDVMFEKVKVMETSPVTVAERSKACTVFARSEAGIVGSNPTQGVDD
jgi:hypothetical protein